MTPSAEMIAETRENVPRRVDRPGWIPSHITENWDTDPYAYQTEDELMPQGGPHDIIIRRVRDVIEADLEERGLMSLSDVFIIFRDRHGVRQRNNKAADIMVVPLVDPPPKAWYLDQRPAPLITMEVPSEPDEEVGTKQDIFIAHGTKRHVVINQLDGNGEVAPDISIRVWGSDGKAQKPDADGMLDLPEIGLKIPAKSPRENFTLHDRKSLEPRRPSKEQVDFEREQRKQLEAELARKDEVLAQKDDELDRLRAELEKLREKGNSP